MRDRERARREEIEEGEMYKIGGRIGDRERDLLDSFTE